MTSRREAVRHVLADSAGFRSAQDIYAQMRADGAKIGLTTVYRALQSLADAGQIDTLRTDDGESVYRACASGGHHHHLVCRNCGRTVEVAGPAVERWADSVGAAHDYTAITHTAEIFGICPACRAVASAG